MTEEIKKKIKDFWNRRPCNIKHSDKEIGTKEYSEEVEYKKYRVEAHIKKFAEFEKWRGKKVLEIGCGIGTDTVNFARAGAKITAVDLSDVSLGIVRQRAESLGLSVKLYNADAEKLSEKVPVEDYDLIYSFGVIHHTPHPEKVLSEIKKYMGPESTLKIMVYNKLSWKALWILVKYGKLQFWKMGKLLQEYSEAQQGCPVTHSYTVWSVRKLMKDFIIKDIHIDHIFPYEIKSYKKHIYKKVWYFRYIPEPIFRLFERVFGWHICVTARIRSL